MTLYAGPYYCQRDVCIGAPHPDKIGVAPRADDVHESVHFWLNAARARDDIMYFSVYDRDILVGQILLHDIKWVAGKV